MARKIKGLLNPSELGLFNHSLLPILIVLWFFIPANVMNNGYIYSFVSFVAILFQFINDISFFSHNASNLFIFSLTFVLSLIFVSTQTFFEIKNFVRLKKTINDMKNIGTLQKTFAVVVIWAIVSWLLTYNTDPHLFESIYVAMSKSNYFSSFFGICLIYGLVASTALSILHIVVFVAENRRR